MSVVHETLALVCGTLSQRPERSETAPFVQWAGQSHEMNTCLAPNAFLSPWRSSGECLLGSGWSRRRSPLSHVGGTGLLTPSRGDQRFGEREVAASGAPEPRFCGPMCCLLRHTSCHRNTRVHRGTAARSHDSTHAHLKD